MQFWKRLPLIIMVTIIFTFAYHYFTANTLSPVFSSSPRNQNMKSQPASDQDLARFEEISRVLSMSERGQATLLVIETYQINVRFDEGNGSRFLPHRNEIVLNSRAGNYSAALTLVHEATHARYHHEGLAADINLLNRQAFIQMKMEEELGAVMNRIEATEELAESGVVVSDLPHVLFYSYRQAYGSAVRAAKSDSPGIDEDTLQDIGRAAGLAAVREALFHGQALTSNTQQSYAAYWGAMWDQSRQG